MKKEENDNRIEESIVLRKVLNATFSSVKKNTTKMEDNENYMAFD